MQFVTAVIINYDFFTFMKSINIQYFEIFNMQHKIL